MERNPDMRASLTSLGIFAPAALLAIVAGVRADTSPWGYIAANSQIFNSDTPLQTSSITFTGDRGVANGDSGIVLYTVTASSLIHSFQDFSAPNSFTNVPFDLKFNLFDINSTSSTDPAAVKSGALDFTGTFSASNVTGSSLLPGQISFSTTPQDVILGSPESGWRDYQVSLTSFTPPGQPQGAPGSIGAIVHLIPVESVVGVTSGPAAAPEPSSLLLAALALPLLLARRRMARKKIAA
jgi:hypothetical protein